MTSRPAVPRLQFSGTFLADVSTVNNDPEHYNAATFRSNYHLPYGDGNPNGWWNPQGTGLFSLVDCTISKAVYTDAKWSTTDSVVGLTLNDTFTQVQGKLVNLDPVQQNVFEIWGMQINLGQNEQILHDQKAVEPDLSSTPSFRGKLGTTACSDFWTKVPTATPTVADPHRLGAQAGVWQGTVFLSHFHAAGSRFMKECEPFLAQSPEDETISAEKGAFVIRMNVDNFCTDPAKPSYRYGRVVGSIRPWLVGDPLTFDAQRQLTHVPRTMKLPSDIFNAYAHIECHEGTSRLYLDVGNALTAVSEGGPPMDYGALLACIVEGGSGGDAVVLGEIDYRAEGWYVDTAGIVQIDLSASQTEAVQSAPLGILADGDLKLMEAEDGYNVRADTFVFRLNPGETKEAQLYVSKFGQRVQGVAVTVGFDSSVMAPQVTQGPIPGPQSYGEPKSAVVLGENEEGGGTTTVTSDEKGIATLKVGATEEGPGNPRGYIDGQIYGLGYAVGEDAPPVGQMNTSEILNLLLFNAYDKPVNPSWVQDIQPIFEQYALLYPAMGRVVDLANYASCMTRLEPLKNAFSADIEDPHYMPVTRDLSQKKKETILEWIGNVVTTGERFKWVGDHTKGPQKPLYMDIYSVDNLKTALQTAIELEHATIPPYLCALYSIKPGYNEYVADIIRSIVIEEMLHFSISCNILISIGGHPNINKPGFVPRYPGPLPGGLRRGLIARLRKCSIEQLRAFMSLEEPRKIFLTEDGKVNESDVKNRAQNELYTIGFLYDLIKASLRALHGSGDITFGHGDKQVEGWANPGDLNKVLSLEDAIKSINEIEEQGEGSSPLDPADENVDATGLPELSHYYKFAEIVYGKRIVIHDGKNGKAKSFSYSGDPIPFDEDGVYDMIDDPDLTTLPEGSAQRLMANNFARKYQAVLNGLHKTFNGEPEYIKKAIAAMFQLTISAQPLMEMDSGIVPGKTVGLSFQLPIEK